MLTDGDRLTSVQEFVGRELGISDWLTIDQERIDQFADCTSDHQWIHVDVERARRESLYGATIAHGYLTLALLAHFQFAIGLFPAGGAQAINYGLDRVRFLAPVRAGARIRNRIVLLTVEDKGAGRLLVKTQNTIEIEGEHTPAMVAEALAILVAH
jgi:acyl dehydratase